MSTGDDGAKSYFAMRDSGPDIGAESRVPSVLEADEDIEDFVD